MVVDAEVAGRDDVHLRRGGLPGLRPHPARGCFQLARVGPSCPVRLEGLLEFPVASDPGQSKNGGAWDHRFLSLLPCGPYARPNATRC